MKVRVESYETKILSIYVESVFVPLVIGKKGEKISKLKESGPGAEIEVEKATGEIKLLRDDKAAMAI